MAAATNRKVQEGRNQREWEKEWFEEHKKLLLERYKIDISPIERYWGFLEEIQKEIEKGQGGNLLSHFRWLQLHGVTPQDLIEGYEKFGKDWFHSLTDHLKTTEKGYVIRLTIPPNLHRGTLTKRMKGSTLPYLERRPLSSIEVEIMDTPILGLITSALVIELLRGSSLDEGRRKLHRIREDMRPPWWRNLTREEMEKTVQILASGKIIQLSLRSEDRADASLWCPNVECIEKIAAILEKEEGEGDWEWPNTDLVTGLIALSEEPHGEEECRQGCRYQGLAFCKGGNRTLRPIFYDSGPRENHEWAEIEITDRKMLLERLKRDIAKKREENRAGDYYLSEVGARQVLVFRVMSGRCIYMDKSRRVVEFGPSGGKYDWGSGKLDAGYLRIVGASALGLNKVWGWSVFKQRKQEGHGGLMVLPNEHWDILTWMWKKDILIWPQFVEARGIPCNSLPAWNGGEGKTCRGDLRAHTYPSYLGQAINNNKFRIMETVLLQDATASDEAAREGEMEVYVPRVSFRVRLAKVRRMVEECKETDQDVVIPLMTKAMRTQMGYLCNLGVRGMILWRTIWLGTRSQTWWWEERRPASVMGVPPRKGYPTINRIKEKLDSGGLLDTFNPVGYKADTERLTMYETWKIAYKGEFAVDERGVLLNPREATDSQKRGESLRREYEEPANLSKKDPPSRFTGRTPILTDKEKTIRREDRRMREMMMTPRYPTCGYENCTDPSHNEHPPNINYKGIYTYGRERATVRRRNTVAMEDTMVNTVDADYRDYRDTVAPERIRPLRTTIRFDTDPIETQTDTATATDTTRTNRTEESPGWRFYYRRGEDLMRWNLTQHHNILEAYMRAGEALTRLGLMGPREPWDTGRLEGMEIIISDTIRLARLARAEGTTDLAERERERAAMEPVILDVLEHFRAYVESITLIGAERH